MYKNYTISGRRLALGALLLFVCVALLFAHVYKITSIPTVISHDEVYYTVQAKTIALTGADPTGTWRPWFFTAADPLYAELPGVVMAPFAWLFPNSSVLAAKLPFVVLGMGIVLMLAALSWRWTRDARVAVVMLIIAGFNPWLFQFSRMGFDSLFSLFFYLLGMTVLIMAPTKAKIWSILPFLLGFFQYQGLKIVFLPVVILTTLYVFFDQKPDNSSVKQHLRSHAAFPLWIVAIVASVWMSGYLVRMVLNPDTKRAQSDLIFSDRAKNTALVDTDRQQSLTTRLTPVFSNKAQVVGRRFLEQYAASYNPTQLFVTGEPLRNPFSVWKWGMFHALDAILLLVGCIALSQTKKYRWVGLLLLGLAVCAPLPSAINSKGLWVMFRSSLMIPTLLLIMAFGVQHMIKHWPKICIAVFAAAYLVSVSAFLYEYFYKYPVYGTQGSYFAEKLIANYIKRTPEGSKVVVLANEPLFVFESLLTFTNAITPHTVTAIQSAFRNGEYQVANWGVQSRCLDVSQHDASTIVIADALIPPCESSEKLEEAAQGGALLAKTAIPSLLDSGALYTIHNDVVCSGHDLGRFSHVTSDVFDLDSVSNSTFCQSFITRE